MGHVTITAPIDQESATNSKPASPKIVPAGAYNRSNEDTLRVSTGMSLKALFSQIVAQNSPRFSSSPSPRTTRALLQRANSLSANSPSLRRPSMDGTPRSTSHILISFPIPEDVASAVCELWIRRMEAARCWWLADHIDFDSPNEDALFTVVRLALIDRVRDAQMARAVPSKAGQHKEVVLFSRDETSIPLKKAIAAASILTGGDSTLVQLLDQVLQRRVASPEFPVQLEEIPQGDNLVAWQVATSVILRHLFAADGALRNSELIDALCIAWEQAHILAD